MTAAKHHITAVVEGPDRPTANAGCGEQRQLTGVADSDAPQEGPDLSSHINTNARGTQNQNAIVPGGKTNGKKTSDQEEAGREQLLRMTGIYVWGAPQAVHADLMVRVTQRTMPHTPNTCPARKTAIFDAAGRHCVNWGGLPSYLVSRGLPPQLS